MALKLSNFDSFRALKSQNMRVIDGEADNNTSSAPAGLWLKL